MSGWGRSHACDDPPTPLTDESTDPHPTIDPPYHPHDQQITEGDEEDEDDEDAAGGVEVFFAPKDPESRESPVFFYFLV